MKLLKLPLLMLKKGQFYNKLNKENNQTIFLLFLHPNIPCGSHWNYLDEAIPVSTHKDEAIPMTTHN